MHASRVVSAALALDRAARLRPNRRGSDARLRVLQSPHRADLHDEAPRQRALRLVPRLRHDDEARRRCPKAPRRGATRTRAPTSRSCARASCPAIPTRAACCAIRSRKTPAAIRITTAASTGPRRATPSGKRSRRGSTARRSRARPRSRPSCTRASCRRTAPATTCTSSIPATNKVVGEIVGIEVGHGAAAAPDGSRLYVSNEADSTLDVVDARTLRVMSKVPLTRPSEQHLDQPRRQARLRRDPRGAGRRRRRRHRRARAREEHSDPAAPCTTRT